MGVVSDDIVKQSVWRLQNGRFELYVSGFAGRCLPDRKRSDDYGDVWRFKCGVYE